jgi:hypothetical protein
MASFIVKETAAVSPPAEAAQAVSRLIGVSRAFASASRKIWFPMLHVFNRTRLLREANRPD